MDLPDGWRVWNDEAEKVVLAYRPDVFNGADFPAPCLPTLYVTRGQRDRRPGGERVRPDEWFVTLFLEPDVGDDAGSYASRDAALDAAREVATRFAAGDYEYRGAYQVPRDDYLDRLDDLTGDSGGGESSGTGREA